MHPLVRSAPGAASETSATLPLMPDHAHHPQPLVAVLDYGSGNVRSALSALERAGARTELTGDPHAAVEADGLVVPGVGSFSACMAGLAAVQGPRIIGQRLAGGRPVLGICVGMQVLFESSVEGDGGAGCGEWPGKVERLQADVLPHMGWNTVEVAGESRMFEGIAAERFYFVHSYGVRRWELDTDERTITPAVHWACHESDRFLAAVENGPLWATQFHPEKSGAAGERLLCNWIDTLRS